MYIYIYVYIYIIEHTYTVYMYAALLDSPGLCRCSMSAPEVTLSTTCVVFECVYAIQTLSSENLDFRFCGTKYSEVRNTVPDWVNQELLLIGFNYWKQ